MGGREEKEPPPSFLSHFMFFMSFLFSVDIYSLCTFCSLSSQTCDREVHVVHEAFALADGVDDVQGGGLGDVLLNELEV